MHFRPTSLLAAAVLCVASSVASAQTTHVVNQVGLSFTPSTLTIAPGDTVQWVWSGGTHTVTSGTSCTPDGLFDMQLDVANTLASFTFNSAGTFDYYCIPHCTIGMVGTITVSGPAPVPALPGWSLFALVGVLVAVGSLMVGRRAAVSR